MLDLDMSPYGAFVWTAWGVSALVLAALSVRAIGASRHWRKELERLEAAASPPPQTAGDEIIGQGPDQSTDKSTLGS